ncbi:MAG: tetratricopeptide repeat protein [Thermodesulfovibrionales bacterium]
MEIERLIEQAETLKVRSLYSQSLRLFKKAFQKYRRILHTDGMLRCLLSIGDIYRMMGNYDLAVKSYSKAIEFAKKSKEKTYILDAKIGLGLSLRAQGKWKESLRLIYESKKNYISQGDKEGIAFSLWAEGGALRIKGDIKDAIKAFKKALEIYKTLKDREGIGYCLCGLGGASRVAGLFEDSLKYYTAANKLFSKTNDIFGLAYSHCGMGNAFRMLNNYKKALLHFSKATRLYQKIGDIVSYSYTLWGMGSTYKMMGKYKKAQDNFRKAVLLFKKTKDPRGIIYCKLSLGEIDFIQDNKTNAIKVLKEAFYDSIQNGYSIEKCHAGIILSYLLKNISAIKRKQLENKGLFKKIDNKCYERLGLRINFDGLPFNIP